VGQRTRGGSAGPASRRSYGVRGLRGAQGGTTKSGHKKADATGAGTTHTQQGWTGMTFAPSEAPLQKAILGDSWSPLSFSRPHPNVVPGTYARLSGLDRPYYLSRLAPCIRISRGEGAKPTHLQETNGCSSDPRPGGFICHPGPLVDLRLVSHLGASLLASREPCRGGSVALPPDSRIPPFLSAGTPVHRRKGRAAR
jgi:hypothetical protein